MTGLSPGLRRYLWVLYLVGLVLIGKQLWDCPGDRAVRNGRACKVGW